ncbi:17737_t:CDS:2 [Entrophospora sp. SA101]|nr:17737_t:CDS:2 [Entrophospora sp. SA101]
MKKVKKSSRGIMQQEGHINWILACIDSTPIAFFRHIFPSHRVQATNKYHNLLNLAIRQTGDCELRDKLKRMKEVLDESRMLQDWETWMQEKAAILIRCSIRNTSINLHEETNSLARNKVSFVTNIFHETVTASAIDKKLADIFKSSTGVGSIMDLCPFSKFSLAIDTDLHEKILHQVFDSIDVLIIDELHSFLTDFFNSDHGPEGWDIAVESLHVSNTEHEIIGKTKKLLKPTLVHFFKAFSLNALNPLRNLETLEKPYLNRFVHPIIDAALWIFGRTNYIYGEIPLQTEKSCIPAFAGMGYFSLYLAGKLHVFDRKGYTYKSFVVVTPLVIAILICISRTQDYRHHWQDVFAGSTLGFILAIFSYYQYYPSIHSPVCDKPYSVRLKKKVPGRSAEFEFADGSNFTVKITREDGGLVYQDNRALLSYDADSLDNISKASSSSNV